MFIYKYLILEYGSGFWKSHFHVCLRMSERVHWKCFRAVCYWLDISHLPHDYLSVLNSLGLSSVSNIGPIYLFSKISLQGKSTPLIHSQLCLVCFKVSLRHTNFFTPFLVSSYIANNSNKLLQ